MYYPKSQIKTNLYTNGDKYVAKSTKIPYVGYYWTTSDGKIFTGKTPQDKGIEELTSATNPTSEEYHNLTSEAFDYSSTYLNSTISLSEDYSKLNSKLASPKLLPISFNPQPTSNDYELKEFTRYFCKKTNETIYTEINQDTYNKLISRDASYLWQLYIPLKYQWAIKGDQEKVYYINKDTTNYMMVKSKLPMLDKFLKEDYLKFWKP